MAAIPAYADFGKAAREILAGGGIDPAYQYDQKLAVSTKVGCALAVLWLLPLSGAVCLHAPML